MPKITEYSALTSINDNHRLVVDDGSAAYSVTPQKLLGLVIPGSMHRTIYRGKNLGSSFTSAQKTAINSGTFDDLFIGDYWTINNVQYRIADMNYYKNMGDTSFSKNHLLMVPNSNMYNHVMNDTNITTGGYKGSKMYTSGLDSARSTIKSAFGSSYVATFRDYVTNATTSGYPSGGEWVDADVTLMNEIAVYGTSVHAPRGNGSFIPANYTTLKTQFALFKLNPEMMNNRANYWLRDVVSASNFAYVNLNGNAHYNNASDSLGVRPFFLLVGA